MDRGITLRRTGPPLGVVIAAILFSIAAARYPGGYDWWQQSISSLFQPRLLDGSANPARWPASLAVVLFCISIAIVFDTIARRSRSSFHHKTIQIAGIGSMVYTALVITPMHDVLVGVALLFFVVAMTTILHRLLVERRFGLLSAGLACLSLTLGNAAMYYGDILYGFLPVVQKIALVSWVAWLFVLASERAPAEDHAGNVVP